MPARFAPTRDDGPLQKVTGGEFVLLTTYTTDENLLNEMHSRFTAMMKNLQEYAQEQMYLYFPSQEVIQYKVTRVDMYEKEPYSDSSSHR